MPTPLPIAIVGLRFGRSAIAWIPERYRTQAVRVAMVCDLDAALAERTGRELGVAWTTSVDAVLAAPADQVAAVGLFTPPAGRAALLRRCLAAGKDVMATKPFELDPDAAAAVLDEARALGRVVHVNSPNPGLAPDLRIMRAWQAEHDLGRAVALRADVWAPYQEAADGSWYDDPVRCPCAPMFRIGIYLINDAVALLGPAEQVFVTTSRIRTGRPTPDQALLSIRHRGGALSAITASLCVADGDRWRNALTLNCERGTIYRNAGPGEHGDGAHLRLARAGDGPDARRTAAEARCAPVWSGEYDWEAFAAAVRTRQALPADDQQRVVAGIRVVAAMAAAERSGTPVALPA